MLLLVAFDALCMIPHLVEHASISGVEICVMLKEYIVEINVRHDRSGLLHRIGVEQVGDAGVCVDNQLIEPAQAISISYGLTLVVLAETPVLVPFREALTSKNYLLLLPIDNNELLRKEIKGTDTLYDLLNLVFPPLNKPLLCSTRAGKLMHRYLVTAKALCI